MYLEPATVTDKAANCVVIDKGEEPSAVAVAAMAAFNKGIIVNEDEAGDDQFVIRFPGEVQGLYDQDQLTRRVRGLSGPLHA